MEVVRSSYMMDAKEVSEVLGTSTAFAYSVIRKLNKELADMGYVVVSGKIPRAFWEKKFFMEGTGAESPGGIH